MNEPCMWNESLLAFEPHAAIALIALARGQQ